MKKVLYMLILFSHAYGAGRSDKDSKLYDRNREAVKPKQTTVRGGDWEQYGQRRKPVVSPDVSDDLDEDDDCDDRNHA